MLDRAAAAAAGGGGGGGGPAGSNERRVVVPSVEDAMRYVEMVKDAFMKEHHPHKYQDFLRIMDHFKNQRIGIAEVTSSVKALFRDSPELILGFNVFLPKGYKIQVGLDELAAYFVRDMNIQDDDDC